MAFFGDAVVESSEQLVVVGEVRCGSLVRGEPRFEIGERRRQSWPDRLGAAGEHRDGAAVDRAGRERAADGERDPVGAVVAA